MDVIGLIPAAGRAARLGRLPCSKEVLPVGFRETPAGPAPVVLCHHLLDRFRAAGVGRAFIVIRDEKLDVPRFLGAGDAAGVPLAYVVIPESGSVPETLDRAFPFVGDALVALGFPDVVFRPEDAYARLLARQAATGADVVLGLFPADQPWRTDMVDLAPDGRVRRIEVRPAASELAFNWLVAVWGPVFGRFLHDFLHEAVAAERTGRTEGTGEELQIGAVLGAAVAAGLRVEGVPFPEGAYRDVGTPADLSAMLAGRLW